MRFLTGAVALATVGSIATATTHAQDPFEGTVTFEARGERGEASAFEYSMKGKRVRFEPQDPGTPMYMVMDLEAEVMRMVMTGENMYMEIPIPDVETEKTTKSANEPVKTDRTDEVAGRKCEIWTMTEGGKSFEMCVARDLGTFMQGGGPMARNATPAWQRELRKGGFFPLRVVEKTSGADKTVLVATKIEQGKLDDSMFGVPAGAKKMSMPPGMGRPRP
jgi:hypothetical protein